MPKVLAADDDEYIRLLYSEELSEEGYEVITMQSWCGLVEAIEEERPDLVILDIKMAGCSGLDLLQDIRNCFCDLPVIIFTVYDHFRYDIRSLAADFFVVKRYDLTELKRRIARALEARLPDWQPGPREMPPDLPNAYI